ncbi:MAG: vWA domain-containing protein [Patescibacteria group bacterium]
MSTFRYWAFYRRLQYGVGYGTIVFLLLVFGYYNFIYVAPSCFDGQQSSGETGVDCGGVCVRICTVDVIQPSIQWAEHFRIVDGQYNALAYVENRNDVASTPALDYTFRFFDAGGEVVTERSGTTILPPDSVYPIFEGRIFTGEQVIARTEIILEPAELWLPATVGRDQFVSSAINLIGADIRPRLNAQVENTELTEAQDVEIVATIFDRSGQPLTASQTFVDIFAPETREQVVFTWPEPIAKTLRSCEVPTDAVIAIDLSGSMNNDGGDPPEPITSVLQAASSFAQQFRSQDQLSVVTFATEAFTNLQLTNRANDVVGVIRALTISPQEETGSTNTGAAFEFARQELASNRHSTDARKVLVLLTDGLATAPDPDPEAFALTKAEQVKSEQIDVYTIGLGSEVNMDFLRAVADQPSQAFNALETGDLEQIYSNITSAICEEGPARIDIIPKTDANFAELR